MNLNGKDFCGKKKANKLSLRIFGKGSS